MPQQLSQNPFADLLNSDFHKLNFGSSRISSLFPSNLVLKAPVIQSQTQQHTIQSHQSLSPVKPTTPTKVTTALLRQSQPKSAAPYSQIDKKPQTQQQQVVHPSPSFLQINFKTSRSDILLHFNSIFLVLHLMHEDLQLAKLRDQSESPRLARLILKLAVNVDPYRKAAFIEYYLKEHRDFLNREEIEQEIKKAVKDGIILREGIEVEEVPRIFRWLDLSLKGGQQEHQLFNSPYPLVFEKSRKVVRLYEILNSSLCHSYIHPSLLKASSLLSKATDYQSLDSLNLETKGLQSFEFYDFKDYLKSDRPEQIGFLNLHLFEKILFTLKEENLSLEELRQLPSIVSLPVLEIVRYARLF